MTRHLGGFAALCLLLVLGAPAAVAQPDLERMLRYVVVAEVGADGTLTVTETVRYHFTSPKHGFLRWIPLYYPVTRADGSVSPYDARKLEIDNPSATMDGQPVPFVHDTEAKGADENFILRIGDANKTITGDHDYRFTYRMKGLLNAPGGDPELFWQALGKESAVAVDHAEVTVTAPGPLGRVECRRGDNQKCSAAAKGNGATFVADKIAARSAVNVVVALPSSVTVPPPIIRASRAYAGSIRDNLVNPGRESGIPGLAVGVTIGLFGLGLLIFVLLFRRSRDRYFVGVIPGLLPPKKATAPQKRRLFPQRTAAAVRFDPPKNVPAVLCGVILRKQTDRGVVAATMTDLAVRGHLTVAEDRGGFRVSRVPGADGPVSPFESRILGTLTSPVRLPGTGRDSLPFRRELGALPGRVMKDALERRWFTGNPERKGHRWVSLVLLALGLFEGLGELTKRGLLWWGVPVALILLGLLLVPGRRLVGRTAVGSAILAQVLDFRRYIEVAEAEQIAEEERQAIFNRYLPYAQVFGLAELWTAKFAAVGAAEPDGWYNGSGTAYGFGDSYGSFASTMDSSATTVSVSSSTGSSSGWSGGSSGFSDSGGSSGSSDGGGGGGGGSW